MKTATRILLLIALLGSCPAWATTYYANLLVSQNINYTTGGAGWYPTQGASCVATGTPVAVGSFANGDVLNANGCTGIAVNVDPGAATGASAGVCGTVTVTTTLATDATNGGAFTYATAPNLAIHANVTATKTTALTITGSTGVGTICGIITGGSTSSQLGSTDAHTLVVVYYVGNFTAGSATGATGLVYAGATGGVNLAGTCFGSNTVATNGCSVGTGTGSVLTGNIVNGLDSQAIAGRVLYTPAATNYIISPKDTSYTLGVVNSHATVTPTDPGIANVRSGTAYGPFTGTLSVTGATSNGYAY